MRARATGARFTLSRLSFLGSSHNGQFVTYLINHIRQVTELLQLRICTILCQHLEFNRSTTTTLTTALSTVKLMSGVGIFKHVDRELILILRPADVVIGILIRMRAATSDHSNLAKAVSNRRGKSRPASYVSWTLKSLHPKQDLDPFSRVCTALPRKAA